MPDPIEISVIIPAYNAERTLVQCLDALFAQIEERCEVIVVDDASTDKTREIACRYPVILLTSARNLGSGPARNRGAKAARGSILLFIDSDVVLCRDALKILIACMRATPATPIIGSYDDDPAEPAVISRFKNLAHHYFHQCSGPEVTSFWTGCGAISRELFFSLNGFDEGVPEIGDVDLGYRLAKRGVRVRLNQTIQVKHLKRWTLLSLIRTDLKLRAFPWARMALKYGYLPAGLNFSIGQRFAALTAILIAALIPIIALRPEAAIAMVPLVVFAAVLNYPLYRLFWRKGGIRLMIGGFILQQIYYLYSLAGLILGFAIAIAPGRNKHLTSHDEFA